MGAPAINCVFSSDCRVTVSDVASPLWREGFLQSRTYQGAPGTRGAGLWVYQYRVDLARVLGLAYVPYVSSVTVDFGPVVNTLDLNGDGRPGDEAFVVTEGGWARWRR